LGRIRNAQRNRSLEPVLFCNFNGSNTIQVKKERRNVMVFEDNVDGEARKRKVIEIRREE